MKISETKSVSKVQPGSAKPVLTGPGWSVVLRGEFYFLRAMPVLTGAEISEVKLSQDQMQALSDGQITAEELLLGSTAQGRADRLDISPGGQAAVQEMARPQSSRNRTGSVAQRHGGRSRSGNFDHRLTVAALIFAAAVFLFIYLGG